MIERQKNSHEHGEQPLDTSEAKKREHELLKDAKEKAESAKNNHTENLKNIREEIEKEAESANKTATAETHQEEPDAANTYWYSREYRDLAFKQLLGKVQAHLSSSEKLASKVMHQPTIEKVSDLGGKTVARPSGVLVGSIFSFVASLLTYLLAKQNGYDMSYSIFIASFVGGFILGIAAEFTFRMARSLMSRN